MVEYDGVSSSLKEHESRNVCSLRQNLQNETIAVKDQKRKDVKSLARMKNF